MSSEIFFEKKATCTGNILYLHEKSFQNMLKISFVIFNTITITMTLNES